MAVMIPQSFGASTVSTAERRLFTRFKRELPDEFLVLHSLGLAEHRTKLWGECDFVVVCAAGVFVIEVKGGGVECRDGEWIFTDRNGCEYRKAEGPFAQANGAIMSLRDSLRNELKRKLLTGYGVMMPDERFGQDGEEIEQGVLLDRRHAGTSLDDYLRTLHSFWTAKYTDTYGSQPRPLNKLEIEQVRTRLRPDVRTTFTLNTALDQVEREQVELTSEQADVLFRMGNNPRTLVSGGAGTGKTLLAVDQLRREVNDGKSVLYLCYNRLLAEHVDRHLDKEFADGSVRARTLHGWFNEVVGRSSFKGRLKRNETDEDYFTRELPELYLDALVEVGEECQFDCLILDEAQDLLRETYVDALDLTLSRGLDEGEWHAFLDPLQNIFTATEDSAIDRLRSSGFAMYDLTVNCRNTRDISVTTSIITGIEVPLVRAVEGGRCDVDFYDTDGCAARVERILEKLFADGVSASDVIVLSPRRREKSSLREVDRLAGCHIRDLTANAPPKRKMIDFCTMHAFKGLERRAVIAIDLTSLDADEYRLLHYCGLTRARAVLHVLVSEIEKSAYQHLAQQFGVRQARQRLPGARRDDWLSGR